MKSPMQKLILSSYVLPFIGLLSMQTLKKVNGLFFMVIKFAKHRQYLTSLSNKADHYTLVS
jgi:hypothetical protein